MWCSHVPRRRGCGVGKELASLYYTSFYFILTIIERERERSFSFCLSQHLVMNSFPTFQYLPVPSTLMISTDPPFLPPSPLLSSFVLIISDRVPDICIRLAASVKSFL